MNDEKKTKKQLIDELTALRKRTAQRVASKHRPESHDPMPLGNDAIFRYFVENANDIVFSLTPDGVFTYVSPNWTEILGHDIDKVVGQPIEVFVHPEDFSICRAFMERVIATGEKQAGVEYRVRHLTGAWRWHTTNASPVHDAAGNIVSYMGIARDITEHKQAEEALRESEKQYRLVFEYAGEAIVIDQDEMHKLVNRRAVEILGYSRDELTSRPFIEFVHPDDREMILERYLKRMKQGEAPDVHPFKIVTKDGTVKWIEIHPKPITWNDKPATLNFFMDITDRKRVEEALRDSELRYQTIFETTGTIMLIVEEDMTISLANDGFESLTGYKRAEIEGKRKWTEFIEKGDLERMVAQHRLRRVDEDRAKKSYEFRLVHKDGSLRDIFLTVAVIPGTKKSVASLMDITERKRAEEGLRNSEEKFRALSESAAAAIFLIQGDKFIYFNPALEKMSGYTTDELRSMNFWDMIHPDYRGLIRSRGFLRLKGENLPSHYIMKFVTKDGQELWGNVSATLITLDGKHTIMGSVFDITDRKRAAEALMESQQQLSNIIEFLPDATLVIDKEEKVIAWNRAIEAMTGIKKEEMLGKGNREYALPFYGDRRPILVDLALHPDREREKEYTAIQRVGDILFGEAYTTHLPQGEIHVSATASLLRDSKGEIIAAIECVRDNTERKRLEERLQRSEKMEVLGQLAGGVAHDLNNVLGVLVGYSELLAEKLPEDSPLRRYAINIQQSGMRGGAIIQDLLTLARRGVIISEVVDLNKIIIDYLRTPEFEKMKSFHPDVKIFTELGEGLLKIKGSPIHLNKTLMNLVSNAAEAISGRGEVTIRTENRYVDQPIQGYDHLQEGDYVILKVSDSGIGIPSRDLRRIFEPFYTKKVMGRSGTGLGLTVVWGAVKDHHGYIDVQSLEGKGTTFTLYFPVTREQPAKAADSVPPPIYMGRGESILVVDDAKEQRELAVNMLERLGYRVEALSGGEEAVEYLKNKKADLVVLDMIMDPGIDGLETFKRIIKINPKQKAVIVSGFSETERVKKTLDLGAGSFIQKPYILETIGLAVRWELDR